MNWRGALFFGTGVALVAAFMALSSCEDRRRKPEKPSGASPAGAIQQPAPSADALTERNAGGVEMSVVPLFESASIYVNGGKRTFETCRLFFRAKGEAAWREGFPPEKDGTSFRGSVVNLREDSEYEFAAELTGSNPDNTAVARASCRTWTSAPPVAKVIRLGKDVPAQGPIRISGVTGKPDGWIKYVAEPGVEIDGATAAEAAITVEKCSHVILEGLRIKGGRRYGIWIASSENVRVVNCELSDWGRVGKQDLAAKKDGTFGTYRDEKGKVINYDGALYIDESRGTVMERCYVHDARGTANPWFYSHPAGPEAVLVKARGSTVLRYNDFIGSDGHRWNDAVEGVGNGAKDGGFNRDADIYGNLFAFGNDDGIELDGGQCNVRFFRNKIEGFLCGVSTAPNRVGPSYIFENLVVNLGDEDGVAGAVIKNGGGSTYSQGRSYFFNNTFATNGSGVSGVGFGEDKNRAYFLGMTRNNIIVCAGGPLSRFDINPQNDYDFDWIPDKAAVLKTDAIEKHGIDAKPSFENRDAGDYRLAAGSAGIGKGVRVPNFSEPEPDGKVDLGAFPFPGDSMLPYRPMPVLADKGRIDLCVGGKANDRASETVTLRVKPDANWTSRFTIQKNRAFDWLHVEPESGVLSAGSSVPLHVSLNMEKFSRGGLYKGVFLARMENGLSVPVMVYARVLLNKFNLIVPVDRAGGASLFKMTPDAAALSGKAALMDGWNGAPTPSEKCLTFTVDIPAAGVYYAFARAKAAEPPTDTHDSLFLSIDGSPPSRVNLRGALEWIWSPIACPQADDTDHPGIRLTAGKHVLKIFPRESILFDALAVRSDALMEE